MKYYWEFVCLDCNHIVAITKAKKACGEIVEKDEIICTSYAPKIFEFGDMVRCKCGGVCKEYTIDVK